MKKVFPIICLASVLPALIWYFKSPSVPAPDLERGAPIRNALAQAREITIVALGDSITAGTNAPYSYVQKVEERLEAAYPGSEVRAINAGAPGDTAEGGLRRIRRDAIAHDPDLVLIEFGWNDLRNGVPEDRFEDALREMVATLRLETKAIVYLMTTTPVAVAGSAWKVRPRNKLIRQLANDLDCGSIDLDTHFKAAIKKGVPLRELMSADGIHPSAKGQDLIAETVMRELIPPD
jgi:acyl-CoA thioesterase-1